MIITPGASRPYIIWGRFPKGASGSIVLTDKSGTKTTLDSARVTSTFAEFHIDGNSLKATVLPVRAEFNVNGNMVRSVLLEAPEGSVTPPASGGGSEGGTGLVFFNPNDYIVDGTLDILAMYGSIPLFTMGSSFEQTLGRVENELTGTPGANLFEVDDRDFTFTGATGLYQLNLSLRNPTTAPAATVSFGSPAQAMVSTNIDFANSFSNEKHVVVLNKGTTYTCSVLCDNASEPDEVVFNFAFQPLVCSA